MNEQLKKLHTQYQGDQLGFLYHQAMLILRSGGEITDDHMNAIAETHRQFIESTKNTGETF